MDFLNVELTLIFKIVANSLIYIKSTFWLLSIGRHCWLSAIIFFTMTNYNLNYPVIFDGSTSIFLERSVVTVFEVGSIWFNLTANRKWSLSPHHLLIINLIFIFYIFCFSGLLGCINHLYWVIQIFIIIVHL